MTSEETPEPECTCYEPEYGHMPGCQFYGQNGGFSDRLWPIVTETIGLGVESFCMDVSFGREWPPKGLESN